MNILKKIRLSQRYENLQTILLNWQFFICTAKSNLTMINLLRIHITWHNVQRNKNCTPLKFVHVETWRTKLVMMRAVVISCWNKDGLERLEAAWPSIGSPSVFTLNILRERVHKWSATSASLTFVNEPHTNFICFKIIHKY